MRKILTVVAASLAATLALSACGSSTTTDTSSAPATLDPASPTKLVVGASPVPHAKILEYVRDNLATDAGLEIEIQEFDDYVLPNEALASGELDANYFQHVPYLESQIAEKGYEFSHGTDEQNPKGLAFEESQPEVVVKQLDDPKVAAALINGNFILNAGLKAEDAIAVESVENNPYANVLVWRTEDDGNAAIAKLDELLHSDEVAEFIKSEWPAGDVIPG